MNQPTRLVDPTVLMLPWQLWHCISGKPLVDLGDESSVYQAVAGMMEQML
jgi:hypothetical protein